MQISAVNLLLTQTRSHIVGFEALHKDYLDLDECCLSGRHPKLAKRALKILSLLKENEIELATIFTEL